MSDAVESEKIVTSKLSLRVLIRIGTVMLVVLMLDQASKLYVQSLLEPGDVVPILPGFLNLTLTYNPGAAFGIFSGASDAMRTTFLSAAIVVALLVVIVFLLRDYHSDRLGQAALALILGGAAGNIVDRVRIGEVVDFIDAFYGNWHWPAFNIADSAICIGVAVLIIYQPKANKSRQVKDSQESEQ